MDILIRILNEKENRNILISQFQDYIWNENPKFDNEEQENILCDLAYDLDFYEPNIAIRNEDKSYYGDEKLEIEIKLALKKLGFDFN